MIITDYQCKINNMETNVFLASNVTLVAQPPVYDELLKEETTSISGHKCYRRINDAYLLLNQNRLDRQTKEALLDNIEHSVGSNGLAELRNKYSDEQLCQMVKSRYIQSQSELQSYMKYLIRQSDQEKSDMEYLKLMEQQKKQFEKKDTVEPKTD